METYIARMFGDVRHERSLMLLISLTEERILKQRRYTDHKRVISKNLAVGKLHRQRISKSDVAVQLLENHFMFIK